MEGWLKSVKDTVDSKNDFVLITVIATKGSTPCVTGDKVVVPFEGPIFGSIGGGNLEFKALAFAEDLLTFKKNRVHIEKYPLGASLGQCCGGYVKVMFESFIKSDSDVNSINSWLNNTSDLYTKGKDFVIATMLDSDLKSKHDGNKFFYSDKVKKLPLNNKELSEFIIKCSKDLLEKSESPTFIEYKNERNSLIEICLEKNTPSAIQPVAVFGAGHISRALMPILVNLPIKIYWIDDRSSQFDKYQGDTSKINILCDDFLGSFSELPDDTYCLVITYSHQIDFEICEKIISKNKFSYLGMIGSAIKAKKFRDRFINKGYQQEVVNKFTCPIGEKQRFLKSPTSIAVTIAMDLINFIEDKRQSASI